MMKWIVMLVTALVVIILAGVFWCSRNRHSETDWLGVYREAMRNTDPAVIGIPDETVVAAARDQFVSFYRIYSREVIEKDLDSVYAEDAYFRDPFHEINGLSAIRTYFLRAAESVVHCSFDIQDFSGQDGEYYFRWVMHLELKRDKPGVSSETPGMSHVRFNRDGKVVFHVDYWDPSHSVYERIPVMASLVRIVRKNLQ